MTKTLILLIIIFYFGYNWAATIIMIEEGELEDNLQTKGLGYLFMLPYQLFRRIRKYLNI